MLIIPLQVTSPPVSPTSSPGDLPQGSAAAGGSEVVTSFNQQGFPVLVTVTPGEATAPKQYDNQGFLITTSASLAPRSSPTALVENAASSPVAEAESSRTTTSAVVTKVVTPSSEAATTFERYGTLLAIISCILAGTLSL